MGKQLPSKEDVAAELGRLAATLSADVQVAARARAKELRYDLTKGRLSFEETLINLNQSRDLILSAAEKGKLARIPLKVQYRLHHDLQNVIKTLQMLVNGTDAIVLLEAAVDDLTATIWQYNLGNLADQIIGFERKMDELKSLETVIRQGYQSAVDIQVKNDRASELLKQIEQSATLSTERGESAHAAVDHIVALSDSAADQSQKFNAIASKLEQYDASAAQFLANAKLSSTDAEAITNRVRTLLPEIEATKDDLVVRIHEARQTVLKLGEQVEATLAEVRRKGEEFLLRQQETLSEVMRKVDEAIEDLNQSKEDTAKEMSTGLQVADADSRSRFAALATKAEESVASVLKDIKQASSTHLLELVDEANKVAADQRAEHKRLVDDLDELEGRIRHSIERATGFTLFHSFQARQIELAKSKRNWIGALTVAVLLSLWASYIFVSSLQASHPTYDVAFYLKLTLSLPLIYAIAFCSVQYSRERRLEEEYAFKSNISISLEPYQKLISQLVDRDRPDEVAKYTAFIIDSVNRVFTSPTERIFEDRPTDKTSAEKVINAMGNVIEPLVKALKK